MPDYARSGTASLSNTFSTYVASRAIDGDETTEAIATSAQPSWLKVDLGSEQTIRWFRVNNAQFGASNYSLQASTDDTNWVTVLSGLPGSAVTVSAITPKAARYWRLLNTDNNGLNIKTFSLWGGEPPYNSIVLQDDPVLYLPLNDASGTTATALAGSNGTYVNSPTLDQPGPTMFDRPAKAVDFNGSNQYVTWPNGLSWSAISYECWFNSDTTMNGTGIISDSFGGGDTTVMFEMGAQISDASGSLLAAGRYSGGWSTSISAVTAAVGTWYHYVSTHDGATIRQYLNGTEIHSVGASFASDTSAIHIGRRHDEAGPQSYFNGRISAAAIYNYALSAAQVKNHYWVGQALWREGGSQAAMRVG